MAKSKKVENMAVFEAPAGVPMVEVLYVEGCVLEGSVKLAGEREWLPQVVAGWLMSKGLAVLVLGGNVQGAPAPEANLSSEMKVDDGAAG